MRWTPAYSSFFPVCIFILSSFYLLLLTEFLNALSSTIHIDRWLKFDVEKDLSASSSVWNKVTTKVYSNFPLPSIFSSSFLLPVALASDLGLSESERKSEGEEIYTNEELLLLSSFEEIFPLPMLEEMATRLPIKEILEEMATHLPIKEEMANSAHILRKG